MTIDTITDQTNANDGPPMIDPDLSIDDADDRRGNRFTSSWTRELVMQRMVDWQDLVGQPPAESHWNVARAKTLARGAQRKAQEWTDRITAYDDGDWPSADTVKRLFGSWNAALKAAGFTPRGPGRQPAGTFKVRHRYTKHVDAIADLRYGMDAIEKAGHDKSTAAMRQAVNDLASICLAWAAKFDEEIPERRPTEVKVTR